MMDFQAYLERIDYTGLTNPTVSTLQRLHLAHLYAVPFENLDIHQDIPIVLDLELLYDKIFRRRRGGFCYELNGLFSWLLGALGFEVDLLSARDVGADGRLGPPFDHMTLQVRCPADAAEPEIPWLADVGWGDSFRYPLRLDRPGEDRLEGRRIYRIDSNGEFLTLWQNKPAVGWEQQYRFSLQPHCLADFEATCAYHQTSPESHFTRGRICTVATPEGRVSLADNRLITTIGEIREERQVGVEESSDLLAKHFGVLLRN